MVYRRRPRKVYRKKKSRVFRKKFTRRTRSPPTKVHYITRWSNQTSINAPKDATSTFGVLDFSLDKLSEHTDLTSVFNLFKIKAVKVVFTPASNVTIADSVYLQQQTAHYNTLYTAIDTVSDAIPTSYPQIRAYQSCKIKPNNTVVTRFLYPKPQLYLDQDGSSGAAFTNAPYKGWLRSDTAHVAKHIGLKFAIEHAEITQDGGITLYDVHVKYYLMFKDPR